MKVKWVCRGGGTPDESGDTFYDLYLDDRRTCGGVQVMVGKQSTLYVPFWLVYLDGSLDGSVHHTSLGSLAEAKETVEQAVLAVPSRNRHRLFPPN